MSPRGLSGILLALIFVLPGCTNGQVMVENQDSNLVPERLNLIAETVGRDIDRGQTVDILSDADGKNTMILWVSTGCSGCHDWTEMIAEEMRIGNISNDTRIISVHRYPAFESRDEVIDVYATENSSSNSLWPVLVPYDGQPAFDVINQEETEIDYAEAFENPATPSFTILDGEGRTIWKNREYWANESVLENALEILGNEK